MKELVVILIIAHKEFITNYEKASLSQCYKVLGNHPIRLICPKGLNVSEYKEINPSLEFDFIDAKWMSSYRLFNRLKIHPLLYKRYKKYKFILFYELDAWVFRDDLKYWCEQNYDYIGAPWFETFHDATPSAKIIGVGNGGFSLRKPQGHITLLRDLRKLALLKNFSDSNKKGIVKTIKSILRLLLKKQSEFEANYDNQEDYFWTVDSQKFIDLEVKSNNLLINLVRRNIFPGKFRVAPAHEALRFSFEVNPQNLFEITQELPFGCHAWERYDKEFWRKHIMIRE